MTGLVASTFPTVQYTTDARTAVQTLSLSDLALITSNWSAGGVKEKAGGYYRLDLPDAAIVATLALWGEASGKHLVHDIDFDIGEDEDDEDEGGDASNDGHYFAAYFGVTGIVIPATEPGRTTGYVTCYDSEGETVGAGDVTIYVQLHSTSEHASGLSHYDEEISSTSDSSGLVEIPGMLRLARYKARRGNGGWGKTFTTADAATTPLPEILGHE